MDYLNRPFTLTTIVVDKQLTIWKIKFTLTRNRSTIRAINFLDRRVYTEQNIPELEELLPMECWPQFAIPEETTTQKEVLF